MTHPANNSYPPQRVPEAAMIEWAEEHGPHVNTPAPWDEILFNYSTKQIWLGVLALGAAIAFVICGAAYMGVSV